VATREQRRQLSSAIRDKLGGISRQALAERAKRLVARLPMTTDDAVAVIAHQHGVPVGRYLDPEELSRVATYVTQLAGFPMGGEQRASRSTHKPVLVQIAGMNVGSLPGMTAAHAREARMMAEKVYPILYVFENSARDVITRVLEARLGPDWWNHVPQRVRTQAEQNMRRESREAWHSKRGEPIQYVDLPQLGAIVGDANLWPLFESILPRPGWFENVLDDLNVSRRVVAHMNPLSRDDIKSVENGFRKWAKQLQAKAEQLP
jgi:hypothetical protein